MIEYVFSTQSHEHTGDTYFTMGSERLLSVCDLFLRSSAPCSRNTLTLSAVACSRCIHYTCACSGVSCYILLTMIDLRRQYKRSRQILRDK
jgi:hypothetical protein